MHSQQDIKVSQEVISVTFYNDRKVQTTRYPLMANGAIDKFIHDLHMALQQFCGGHNYKIHLLI